MAAPHPIDARLRAAATQAGTRAYAPYSGFSVGVALLADNGEIYTGANIENAAYPVGNCAEPIAIAAMVMDGGRRIDRIYVTGPGTAPVTPCGACRQRIREFGTQDTVIIAHGLEGEAQYFTLEALLPHAFGPEYLAQP